MSPEITSFWRKRISSLFVTSNRSQCERRVSIIYKKRVLKDLWEKEFQQKHRTNITDISVIFSMQDLAYCGHLSKQQEAASYSAAVQSPFQFILMRREKLGLAHLLFSYEPLQTFIVCLHGYWIVCQAVFLAVCFIFLWMLTFNLSQRDKDREKLKQASEPGMTFSSLRLH